jgi:cyclase
MIATRIISTLLWRGQYCVKGQCFKNDRLVGTMQQAIRVCELREVDELVIFDLSMNAPRFREMGELCKDLFMPLTIGGGINTLDDIERALRNGADKVAICGMANHRFIHDAALTFGSQAITVVINAKKNLDHYVCHRHDFVILRDPVQYAVDLADNLCGEIILQSIDRDGTMRGYDLELIEKVAKAVNVPVVASGGCSGYPDMVSALQAGAHAVSAGALFLFTESTPALAAEHLAMHGYHTRRKQA